MASVSIASHMPKPPTDRKAYARLYETIDNVDTNFFGDLDDWQTIRIPPRMPAAAVYRLLPAAPDQEFGGYLTQTRIRYWPGCSNRVEVLSCKACTFHSHPLAHRWADVPSPKDIYSFLRYRNLRAVTVGSRMMWVFDKRAETLKAVKRLNDFENLHMLETIPKVGFDEYPDVALRGIGMKKPRSLRTYARIWPDLLRQTLGIRVTLLPTGRS